MLGFHFFFKLGFHLWKVITQIYDPTNQINNYKSLIFKWCEQNDKPISQNIEKERWKMKKIYLRLRG